MAQLEAAQGCRLGVELRQEVLKCGAALEAARCSRAQSGPAARLSHVSWVVSTVAIAADASGACTEAHNSYSIWYGRAGRPIREPEALGNQRLMGTHKLSLCYLSMWCVSCLQGRLGPQ